MIVVNQSAKVKLLADFNQQSILIEDSGRVAYQSEDLITDDSASSFIQMIKKRNHGAVLEHSSMTVKFITDRGVSHELVRHRLASFTQESTRYCNYSKGKFGSQITIVRPSWMPENVVGEWQPEEDDIKRDLLKHRIWKSGYTPAESFWLEAMLYAETAYMSALKTGWSAQQARSILPNSLKTTIVITANIREWLHIFQLRAIEKAAHPQMRDLMLPVYYECRERAPHIFDLGDPE